LLAAAFVAETIVLAGISEQRVLTDFIIGTGDPRGDC
jgi:hypothetical protein